MNLKEIMIQNKSNVQKRKQEQEQLLLNTDGLLIKAKSVLKQMEMKVDISVIGGDKQTGS